MASGPPVRGDNGARERPRYAENKVYTRKVFKGSKKDPLKTVAATKPPATVSAAAPEPTSAPPSVPSPNSEPSPVSVTTITIPAITTTAVPPDPALPVATEPTLAISPEPTTPAIVPEELAPVTAPAVVSDAAPAPSLAVVPEPAPESGRPITTEPTPTVLPKCPSALTPGSPPDSTPTVTLDPAIAVAPAPDVEITNSNGNIVDNHSSPKQAPPETIELSEDADSLQQQPETSHPDAVGDGCSLNQEQSAVPSASVLQLGNSTAEQVGLNNKVKINLASRSRQEVRELRRRLQGELDVVRTWVKRIEEKESVVIGFSQPPMLENVAVDNGVQRVQPEVVSISVPPRVNRPLNQLSISVLENSLGITDGVEKEKRTPKANPFYRNSEFLLAKDKFPPAESNRKSKVIGKKKGTEMRSGHGIASKFFKSCSSLLDRLMKHTYGWVFNSPVDVKGLGLHDYYTIIKHPMDLSTVKARLTSHSYRVPKEFADDVRLTFHNAMTYNPKGQDVHYMAANLLKIFEEKWAIIESDYNRELRFAMDYEMSVPTPTSRKGPPFLPPSLEVRRMLDRSESITHSTDFRPKPVSITPTARTPAPKKPKAKDPHKRDMTFDEKQKLSTNLQNLPSDKLDNIVQIIKKRNSALRQHDDEIEVDIDSVDTETLWELDRFVTNYKKSLSKHRRKAELALQAKAQAPQAPPDKDTRMADVEVPQETHAAQNVVSSSPVQDENHGVNSSRSSSSSSSSSESGSSSSDSDSDSSSGSESDAGHSPRT